VLETHYAAVASWLLEDVVVAPRGERSNRSSCQPRGSRFTSRLGDDAE